MYDKLRINEDTNGFYIEDIPIQYLEIYCKTFSIFSTIPSLWFLVPHLLETGAIVSFQLKIPFYDFVCCSLVHKVCLCCWLTNCLNFLTRSTYPISRLLYSFHYFSTSPFIFISSKNVNNALNIDINLEFFMTQILHFI